MATAAKKATGKQLRPWDEELARRAVVAAKMEASTASAQFFSLNGGVLSFNDAPLPGNEMAVIIVDAVLENVYYEKAFQKEVSSPPTCFAFGREERDMAPHATVVEAGQAQCEACHDCPLGGKDAWGTARIGRGKACRNTRRLALLPAGAFDKSGRFKLIDEIEHYKTTPLAFMKLPLTSVKGYSAYVKQLTNVLNRPLEAMVTHVRVVPDANDQFKVLFEAIDNVPNELLETIFARAEEAAKLIEQPYNLEEREQSQAKRKGAATKRTAPQPTAAPKATSRATPTKAAAPTGRKY